MGFRLMTNFDRPYFARSIGEFWRRWHISLSTWFRDYVYVPLGGSRVGAVRWSRNILFVFMLSGLWHGANWTYVVWGTLHGFYLIAGRATEGLRHRLARWSRISKWPRMQAMWQIATTFSLVSIGWVFFRATDVAQGWLICRKLADGSWGLIRSLVRGSISRFDTGIAPLFTSSVELVFCLALIAGLVAIEMLQRHATFSDWFASRPLVIRWGAYQMAVIAIVLLGQVEARQFIYFQF